MMVERAQRKTRVGVVISDARDNTVTVEISQSFRHPRYDKIVRRRKRFHVHDEINDAKVGDTVGSPRPGRCRRPSGGALSRSWSAPNDPAGVPAQGGGQQRCT